MARGDAFHYINSILTGATVTETLRPLSGVEICITSAMHNYATKAIYFRIPTSYTSGDVLKAFPTSGAYANQTDMTNCKIFFTRTNYYNLYAPTTGSSEVYKSYSITGIVTKA